jgi:hypothetical protein
VGEEWTGESCPDFREGGGEWDGEWGGGRIRGLVEEFFGAGMGLVAGMRGGTPPAFGDGGVH